MKDRLTNFDPRFQEVHYNLTTPPDKKDGNCYIYNPEIILSVQPITLNDRIEYLVVNKR